MRTRAHSTGKEMRSGLATLEFVLVLPFLLLFTALIFKTGELMLKKTRMNVQARVQAQSSQQFQEEGSPLPSAIGIEARQLLIDSGTFGLMDARAAQTINFRPILYVSEQVPGRYLALRGTWDSRSISFPRPPQGFPIADKRAFALAAMGEIPFFDQFIATDKTDAMQQVQQIGQKIINQNLGSVNNAVNTYNNLVNQFQNPAKLSGDLLTLYKKRQDVINGFARFNHYLQTLFDDLSKISDQNSRAFRDD